MNSKSKIPELVQSNVSTDRKWFKPNSSNTDKLSPVETAIDRNPGINDRNMTGFCMVFAFFVGGLITNIVIASKIIALGPFFLPASVFIYALTFPCSDIAAEVYGRKYAHKLVMGGFVGYATAVVIFMEAVAMPPAPFWEHQEAFETVLNSTPRVVLAAVISYAIAQFCDVHLFGYIRQKTKGRHLWLRNNLSTLTSQTLSNIIFLSIAFLGVFPMEKWWMLFFSNLFVRYCLAFVDTTIVYAGVHGLYKLYPELKPKLRPKV